MNAWRMGGESPVAPKAGIDPNGLDVLCEAPKAGAAAVDVPNKEGAVDPNRDGVLAAGALNPNAPDVIGADVAAAPNPKAGVDEAPNAGAGADAPNAGVDAAPNAPVGVWGAPKEVEGPKELDGIRMDGVEKPPVVPWEGIVREGVAIRS